MASRKDVLWANSMNLVGLYNDKPIRLTKEDSELMDYSWWDEEGEYDCPGPGFHEDHNYQVIQYASHDRQKVVAWTQGVLATMKMMRKWCGEDYLKNGS